MGRHAYLVGALALLTAGAGCSANAECAPGAFRCACDVGSTCAAGLLCEGGRCVAAPGTDAGVDDAGPGFDSGHPVGFDAGPRDAGTAYCGPDGGGTASMPTSCTGAAVPGCPCDTVGATDTCTNGRTITCDPNGEFGGVWSACTGSCFSSGTWHLDNTSPCLLSNSSGVVTDAFSSWIAGGSITCGGPYTVGEPVPTPTENWSNDQLTVDCQGQFTLCYTIKAGDASAPTAADCTVGQACTSAFYGAPNVLQELPPLGPWLSSDASCAQRFAATGGYGEMTVVGVTLDCQQIGATDHPYVFNRTPYCPLCCSDSSCSDGFDCGACTSGGSGGF